MKLLVLIEKCQAFALLLAMLFGFEMISAETPVASIGHHSMTWSGYDLVPRDTRKRVIKFDGKTYPATQIEDFQVPEAHLKSGDILDVYIPDQAKVDDPDFIMPLTGNAIFSYWLRAGVKIVYHYKGHVLKSRVLIVRWRSLSDEPYGTDRAEVSLDGKQYGVGAAAFDKIAEVDWTSTKFLDVRFIHDYPNEPSRPGVGLPGFFNGVLGMYNVKLNGGSSEFSSDKDPWTHK